MIEFESQPRLVWFSVHAQCVGSAPQRKKPIKRSIRAIPLLGYDFLILTQPCCSYHQWHVKFLFPKCESVEIGRLIYFCGYMSVTLFLKSTSWQLAHHTKSLPWGHANMTLNRRSDLSHWKCSIKSFDGSHQHIQQCKKNLGTFLRNRFPWQRIEILRKDPLEYRSINPIIPLQHTPKNWLIWLYQVVPFYIHKRLSFKTKFQVLLNCTPCNCCNCPWEILQKYNLNSLKIYIS